MHISSLGIIDRQIQVVGENSSADKCELVASSLFERDVMRFEHVCRFMSSKLEKSDVIIDRFLRWNKMCSQFKVNNPCCCVDLKEKKAARGVCSAEH